MKINVKMYARFFEVLCMILIPVSLVLPGLVWFFGDKLMDSSYGIDLKSFSLLQRLGIFAIDFAGSIFVIYGLSLCIKISRLFQKEEVFSPLTTTLFFRLSKVAAYWGFYRLIELLCIYSFFMHHYPKPLMIVAVGLSSVSYLLIFIFLSILATLVSKATQLQVDQDLTV